MEKRLIAALIISVVFFVAYDKYVFQLYSKPEESLVQEEKKSSPNDEIQTQNQAEKTTSNITKLISSDTNLVSTASLVTIDSPLYTAKFSGQGATIRNFYQKGYSASNEDGVSSVLDLVKPQVKAYPLATTFQNPSLTYLDNVSYSVSKERVDVISKAQDDLIFVYEDERIKIIKKFTFYRDNYLIDYTLQVVPKENVDHSFVLSIGPGLGGEKQSYDMFTYDRIVTFIDRKKNAYYLDDVAENKEKLKGEINWISVSNKYFTSILAPETQPLSVVNDVESELMTSGLEYSSEETISGKAYFGPQISVEMDKLSPDLEYIKDYGIFSFLAMPLFKFLSIIHTYLGNWGWAIITLTLIIKIIFYPLTRSSFRSMAKMRELSPQLKIIQERYKDDRQKLSQEMMNLYRENKANPMGGCLPMLLQIPIFIALYNVLLVSIEVKGAPFVLWIHDLSEKDPYYITPVLMGVTMLIQQKISPPMGDPLQQKIMLLLPVVFTFLFLSFPAGLVIYWVVNNILTISQQWYIYKKADAEKAKKSSSYVFKSDTAVVAKKVAEEVINTEEKLDAVAPRKKAERKKGQGKKRR